MQVLMKEWAEENGREYLFNPADLSFVMCRQTNSEEWFLSLVSTRPGERLIIQGDPCSSRDKAIDGFRTRVEWLLWKHINRGDTWGVIHGGNND